MNNVKYYESYKDMFNIYNLITLINKDYRLMFNKKEKTFYIINIAKNYQICLKFKNFSSNIMKTLQETRIENSKKIFKEIDEFNDNLTKKNEDNLKFKTNNALNNLINYSKRTNSINKNDINKIIEGTL